MTVACQHVEIIGPVARLFVGGAVALAGGLKWGRRAEMLTLVHSLGLPRSRLWGSAARLLPAIELLLGLWLIVGGWTPVALGGSLILLTSFTGVLLIAIRRGYRGSCACFGAIDGQRVGLPHIVRNGVLLAAVGLAGIRISHTCTTSPVWQLSPTVLFLAIGLLLSSAATYALALAASDLLRRASLRLE